MPGGAIRLVAAAVVVVLLLTGPCFRRPAPTSHLVPQPPCLQAPVRVCGAVALGSHCLVTPLLMQAHVAVVLDGHGMLGEMASEAGGRAILSHLKHSALRKRRLSDFSEEVGRRGGPEGEGRGGEERPPPTVGCRVRRWRLERCAQRHRPDLSEQVSGHVARRSCQPRPQRCCSPSCALALWPASPRSCVRPRRWREAPAVPGCCAPDWLQDAGRPALI